MKIHSSIIIHLDGCGNIEITQRNLLTVLVEYVNRLSHDGVVGDFLLVAVAKYEHGRVKGLCILVAVRLASCRGCRWSFVLLRDRGLSRRYIDHDVKRLLGGWSGVQVDPPPESYPYESSYTGM